MSTWEVIKSPGVAVVLYLTGHMVLIALGYTAGLLRPFGFFFGAFIHLDLTSRPFVLVYIRSDTFSP
jgi:hypothetical protein